MSVQALTSILTLAVLLASCNGRRDDDALPTGALTAAATGEDGIGVGETASESDGEAGTTGGGDAADGVEDGNPDDGAGSGSDSGAEPETCPGVAGSTLPLDPGNHLGLEIEFDGVMRSFGLHVPAGYDTTVCNPVLLFLHGTDPGPTERDVQATYMAGSGWDTIAAQHKFLVAYPVGTIYPELNAYGFYTRTQQEQIDHHRWIDTVRQKLIDEGAADPNRVYVMGFSTGGFAAGEALVMTGDKYAAYGVHGAGGHPNLTYNVRPAGRGVYLFIGAGDGNHIEFSRTMVEQLRASGWTDGVDLIYTERQGWGHQYDASLNAEQWAFFTQFSLAPDAVASPPPGLARPATPSAPTWPGAAIDSGRAVIGYP